MSVDEWNDQHAVNKLVQNLINANKMFGADTIKDLPSNWTTDNHLVALEEAALSILDDTMDQMKVSNTKKLFNSTQEPSGPLVEQGDSNIKDANNVLKNNVDDMVSDLDSKQACNPPSS